MIRELLILALGEYRLLWHLCPLCNCDAPECDQCPVCKGNRELVLTSLAKRCYRHRFRLHVNRHPRTLP